MATTLQEWITANPNHDEFKGTAAGVPMAYQVAEGAPTLDANDWTVWDYAPELPDTSQSPAEADITPTGRTARVLIPIVPDAPSATEIDVNLGQDTDGTLDAIQELIDAYQGAAAQGKQLFLLHYLGAGVKSQVYAASVTWDKSIVAPFPDPLTTTVAVTPNLGVYNELKTITSTGG